MRQLLMGLSVLPMLLGCSAIPGLSSAQPPSVAGEWVVTRPSYSAFNWTLFEDGNTITGSTSNNSPISGSRNATRIGLTLGTAANSTLYEGDISSDGKKITGTIGGDSSDTFVANKKP